MAILTPADVTKASEIDAAAAIRLIVKVFDEWALSVSERCSILGIAARTYDSWRKDPPARLSRRDLEPIAYVFGIYEYAYSLFGNRENVLRFLRTERRERPFIGRTPLVTITSGSAGDLYAVYQWMYAQAQGL